MIKNNDQLEQTQKALGHAERALGYLIQEKGSLHPSRFAVMAEGDIRDSGRCAAKSTNTWE